MTGVEEERRKTLKVIEQPTDDMHLILAACLCVLLSGTCRSCWRGRRMQIIQLFKECQHRGQPAVSSTVL